MGQKQHFVTIKGTKDGLTLQLDDQCSFQQLLDELEEKLSSNHRHEEDRPLLGVRIQVGNRFVTQEQEEQIKTLVRTKKNLVVESIDSNVVTKDEALQWKKDTEIVSVSKIIRSGQVLETRGDLLLIGDVNPGGKVIAGGNIFVMGALRGIAHAGYSGNREAVIGASQMTPSQIRIAELVSRAPDHYDDGHEMECAYIDSETNQIVIDRMQVLPKIRPNLTMLERGM